MIIKNDSASPLDRTKCSSRVFCVALVSLFLIVYTNALGQQLHNDAKKGNVGEVERLIEEGADVNERAENGVTPLDLAVLEGHIRMAELLRKHEAKEQRVQAQEISGCKMSDLSIDATIPKGYTRIPTECPMVAYKKNLSPKKHALGFYFTETPYPYNSSDKKSLSETVDDYILIVRVQFDIAYKGQSYNTQQIYENTDYPPSLVDHGGACGGLVARTPEFYQGHEGVEWRRGIICLVELPPTGSEKWTMIQAFFFDKNFERTDYKPTADFEQVARRLFRSIRIKGLKEDNGLRRIQ